MLYTCMQNCLNLIECLFKYQKVKSDISEIQIRLTEINDIIESFVKEVNKKSLN
jgi:hypothetical protein